MKNYTSGSIHITFRSAANLDAHLTRLAHELGISKSELIRRTAWKAVRTAIRQKLIPGRPLQRRTGTTR